MIRAYDVTASSALVATLILVAAPRASARSVRQVLLLQSSTTAVWSSTTSPPSFRVDLDHLVGSPVNVFQVVVVPTGLAGTPDTPSSSTPIAVTVVHAGPDRDHRWPGSALRAAVPPAAVSRPDAPVHLASISATSTRHRWARTRRPCRRPTISRSSSTTSCSCCPRPGRSSW